MVQQVLETQQTPKLEQGVRGQPPKPDPEPVPVEVGQQGHHAGLQGLQLPMCLKVAPLLERAPLLEMNLSGFSPLRAAFAG